MITDLICIPGSMCIYEYSYVGLYTLLLLLNSSCGATSSTRRNRHNQDHDTESHRLPAPCPPGKQGHLRSRRFIVDNESLDGDTNDGVEPVDSRLSDVLLGAEPILRKRYIIWYHTSKYFCSGTSTMNAHVSTFESRTYV